MLTIGKRIEISIIRNGEKYVFPSKVEDIKNDSILVGMPLKGNKTFPVSLGETVYIYFLHRDSFYCVEGLVLSKNELPIPLMLLKLTGLPYKIQRRQYYRLKVSIKAEIKDEENEDYIEGLIKDLSASGALVAVKESFEKETGVNIRFTLGKDLLELNAVVKRTEYHKKRSIYPYDVAIQFKDINEPQRDIIIKFILEQQRLLRKKGLI